MTTPIISRKRLMLAVQESALGTAVTLLAAHGVTNCFDAKIEIDSALIEREAQMSAGRLYGVAGATKGKATWWNEIYGKGSSGVPYWVTSSLLQCGCANSSGVISPSLDIGTGATVGTYQGSGSGARLKQLCGAMGNAVMDFEIGKPGKITWAFDGLYIPATSGSPVTPTYDTVTPPTCVSMTITVGSTAYVLGKVKFDLGNKVMMRPSLGGAYGYQSAWITDRKPMLTIDPEAVALSATDWYGIYQAGTPLAVSMQLGSAVNNTMTLAIAKAQLMKPPTDGDRDGNLIDNLEFLCCQNASTADSEWTLTFA